MKRDKGLVSVDGRIVEPSLATVNVFDHGFLFGDSVYEVLACFGGIPFAIVPHLERLTASAERLHMTMIPPRELWLREMQALLDAHRHQFPEHSENHYLRIILSRGVGEMSLEPIGCDRPVRILIALPYPQLSDEQIERGISVMVPKVRRYDRSTLDPAIKSGNYLNSALAYMEARRAGADDALMLNPDGNLTELSTSNLMLVEGGRVRTPRLEDGILDGVTRRLVLDLCRGAKIPAEEVALTEKDLGSADELFLTSTLKDVLAITTLNGRKVGSGRPGAITRMLRERLLSKKSQLIEADRTLFLGL